jgi:catechol 2,3-dioxygenase-like lactoylglutathione lyase family enzyme
MHFNKLIPEQAVSDFTKSLDFNTRVLGFNLDYGRNENKFAFLSINGAQLMIEEDNGNWVTDKSEYPRGRGINFEIAVKEIEPILARLREEKVSLFREPAEKWRQTGTVQSGQIEFLVLDPDGYLLRFCQWLNR